LLDEAAPGVAHFVEVDPVGYAQADEERECAFDGRDGGEDRVAIGVAQGWLRLGFDLTYGFVSVL
jgi:hypothetical protein